MREFDLAAAKAGAAVCTREGRPVKFLHVTSNAHQSVIVFVYDGSERRYGEIGCYTTNGQMYPDCLCVDDLMMRDDDYAEKLARGEYGNHIEDKLEKVDPTIKENLTVDREYWRRVYAGMAMQGIFAGRNWCKGAAVPDCIDYAQDAVKLADALLEELEKTEKKL